MSIKGSTLEKGVRGMRPTDIVEGDLGGVSELNLEKQRVIYSALRSHCYRERKARQGKTLGLKFLRPLH